MKTVSSDPMYSKVQILSALFNFVRENPLRCTLTDVSMLHMCAQVDILWYSIQSVVLSFLHPYWFILIHVHVHMMIDVKLSAHAHLFPWQWKKPKNPIKRFQVSISIHSCGEIATATTAWNIIYFLCGSRLHLLIKNAWKLDNNPIHFVWMETVLNTFFTEQRTCSWRSRNESLI